MLDSTARRQIRATRQTLLDHLREEPGDFKALFLAGVIAEIDPDRDHLLLTQAARSTELRARLGTAWGERARKHGLDVLLFNLCEGMHKAGIGTPAIPVLARRCAEVSSTPVVLALLRERVRELDGEDASRATAAIESAIAERAPRVIAGIIDASFIPAELQDSPHAMISFHRTGHLAQVIVEAGATSGYLTLAVGPGIGSFLLEGTIHGSGHMTSEVYRDGHVVTTHNTPWHDGTETTERIAWACWVAGCLRSLADAVADDQKL